jgi:hypothetical protein
MKAILKILNTYTGKTKTLALVLNSHISGNSIEAVIQEFTRQGGKVPSLKYTEKLIAEVR